MGESLPRRFCSDTFLLIIVRSRGNYARESFKALELDL